MDLRKRDLSNPLLRSSSLTSSSSQHVKVKISHGLHSTENKLLKKASILSVAGKKKSSRTDETKGYSFLISDSALKRKLSDRVSPLSSIESASRYTLQSSSHLLVSKKTSDTKKRLILSTTQPRFHGLIESYNKQLPISKKDVSSPHETFFEKQHDAEQIPLWERTISSDFSFPEYDFSMEMGEEKRQIKVETFDKLHFQENEEKMEVESELLLQRRKQNFINSVSASLIGQADFHNPENENRQIIAAAVRDVVQYDPEFILKVALYTRKELNIRTTANFLLAVAAFNLQCRPFLKKYFQKSIALPSDWIEVAEIYLTFHDASISFGALPACLRKVMISKFPDFDKYQLGKYNKDKRKTDAKKKGKEKFKKRTEDELSEDEEEEDVEKSSFNLKELIRKLHITEPVEHVMCLIGKRYPDDIESFYKSRLPGTWEPERAGKRMKLPTPETWETQVSLHGNKAETWESLIDHKKLPFMAMLRNLRNMIKAGMSSKHISWVVKKLTDERSVNQSKQFPFRFFSAYQVLEEMEDELTKAESLEGRNPVNSQRDGGRRGFRGKGRGRGRGRGNAEPFWKKRKAEQQLIDIKYDRKLLQRFRKALDTAVKIATSYNVKPIKGRTLILCSVTEDMWGPCTSARGLGKPKTVLEVGILLGLMCKYSCEECLFILCDSVTHEEVELEEGTILDNMKSVLKQAEHMLSGESSYGSMGSYFLDIIRSNTQIDALVILSDNWMRESSSANALRQSISSYRHLINRNLLFVDIALKSATQGVSSNQLGDDEDENDIHIAGFSDQILRFIAERGDTGQINHVDNIDKAYTLKNIQSEKMVLSDMDNVAIIDGPTVQRWRTVRVFISSTFKDMHGERDILTRYVFPELRSRARKLLLNVVEVDLRWGVTEEETHKSVEICLSEVAGCDYFICILGDRYGYIPESYPLIPGPEFEWLSTYSKERSITELEVEQALLKDVHKDKSFFFLRNSSFLNDVPRKWSKQFREKSDFSSERSRDLKRRILLSGCEAYVDYPCIWGGLVDGKPITTGLEEFGERVLNNLWNSISKNFSNTEITQNEAIQDEQRYHTALMDSYTSVFVGRKQQLIKTMGLLKGDHSAVIVITGQQGCGKSAFMSAISQEYASEYPSHRQLVHFVGASPGSGQLHNVLWRICWMIKVTFKVPLHVPDDYRDLVTKLPKFLEHASAKVKGSRLFIAIDGLDQLTPQKELHNMEWLPMTIPANLIFLLSCVENKECHKSLQRRRDVSFYSLGPLDILDKSEMVRKLLAIYRKRLDESPFNNQMKLLVSKRQANLAMFLSLACEEVRMFGIFEEVSSKLKSLSHTMETLLQEVIGRLEKEQNKNMIQQSLVLLTCVRDGLEEMDLHHLLSLAYQLKDQKFNFESIRNTTLAPHQFIPAAVFARLKRSIKSLIQPGRDHSSQLRINSEIISNAISHRYLKGTGGDMRTQMHILLAGYFCKLADPHGDGKFTDAQMRGITELPYHLTHAGLFKFLETTLCNLHFIGAYSKLGATALLPDCFQVSGKAISPSRVYRKELEVFTSSITVKMYKDFIQRCLYLIDQCPSLVWQEAVNQPSSSVVCQDALKELNDLSVCKQRVVLWKNKEESDHPSIQTLSGFVEHVSCLDISPDGQEFACGSKDSVVRLFEMATGKEKRSFYGHSHSITAVCFVGKDRLVSSSKDGLLSLWDVHQGHRISQMTGHRCHVNWCCTDQGGCMVASASWDCMVKLWDGRSGDLVCTLTEKRPINSVAFHSGGRKIVTASWDTTLKIWDCVDKKRLAVLRGHKSSVRSVSWSPNDVYLASAAMDGSVIMWSADNGVMVGSLTGHALPISELRFSPSGLELVTVSDDHSLKVWSGTLGKQVCSQKLDENSASTVCVFSPGGDLLLIGYHCGTVSLLNVSTGLTLLKVKNHESRITSAAWCSHNGFILGYQSGILEILSSEDGQLEATVSSEQSPVTSVSYASKTRFLAASFENGSIMIWRYRSVLAGVKSLPLVAKLYAESSAAVSSIAFSPDNMQLAVVTRDKMIILWALDEVSLQQSPNKPTLRLYGCHKDWINSVAWSDNGDYLVTGSNDCSLKLWSLSNRQTKVTFEGHQAAVTSVAFSHGCIVSSSADGQLKIWSHRGVEITTLHCHDRGVNCCDIMVPKSEEILDEALDVDVVEKMVEHQSWTSIMAKDEWKEDHRKKKLNKGTKINLDEVMVVSSSDDGTCQVWRPFQGNELCTLTGHRDRVLAVAVSRDGRVISSSLDRTIRVWKPLHVKETRLAVHKDAVTSIVQSPSGNTVVTMSRDGAASLWYQNVLSDDTLIRVHTWQVFDCSVNCAAFINEKRIIFGGNDGGLSSWVIENSNNLRLISVKRKQEKLLKSLSQGRHGPLRPVTAMSYSYQDDILYVTTWDAVETIEGLQKGKWIHSRRKLDHWTSSICHLPQRFAAVGLLDKRHTMSVNFNDGMVNKFQDDVNLPAVVSSLTVWKGDMPENEIPVVIYGLEDGSLYTDDQTIEEKFRIQQVHSDKVTAILIVEHCFITASADAKIKLWKKDKADRLDLLQVGQFNCQAPVTSISARSLDVQKKLRVVCGDQLGQVYVLEF